MGYTSIPLVPVAMALPSSPNSFVSGWGDKRSGNSAGISVVFYGPNAPDGYAWIEASNAIVQPGNQYNSPNFGTSNALSPATSGDDAWEVASTQTTITLNPITGLYTANWLLTDLPARWVRLRYTSLGNVAGLSVNVYLAVPHYS